jgi:hypothetical protein
MNRLGSLTGMLFFLQLALLPHSLDAQRLIKLRSVQNLAGSSVILATQTGNCLVEQSIGQHGLIGKVQAGPVLLRQGFIQPPQTILQLDESSSLPIHLAPNPFTSGITISLPEELGGELLLSILDMYGKTIYYSKQEVTPLIKLDLATLEPGIFILRIKTSTGCFVSKLVKK